MRAKRGRKRYWERHWLAWRASGLTQRGYCDEQGLSFTQFAKWRTRLTDRLQPRREGGRGFVPIVVRPKVDPVDEALLGGRSASSTAVEPGSVPEPTAIAGKRCGIEIRLGKGRSLVVSGALDVDLLRQLVGVLETC